MFFGSKGHRAGFSQGSEIIIFSCPPSARLSCSFFCIPPLECFPASPLNEDGTLKLSVCKWLDVKGGKGVACGALYDSGW